MSLFNDEKVFPYCHTQSCQVSCRPKEGVQIQSSQKNFLSVLLSYLFYYRKMSIQQFFPLLETRTQFTKSSRVPIFIPVSLLLLVSTITERIIHDQTTNFLSENSTLCKFQLGFGIFHSTDSSLSYRKGVITKVMSNQKGFRFRSPDRIGSFLFTKDHHISVKEMHFLGFTDETIKWYVSLKQKVYYQYSQPIFG